MGDGSRGGACGVDLVDKVVVTGTKEDRVSAVLDVGDLHLEVQDGSAVHPVINEDRRGFFREVVVPLGGPITRFGEMR